MKNRISNLIAKQFKRPSGIFGKYVSKKMQEGNNVVYKWMISLMEFGKAKNVLEIGYGTGKVLLELAVLHDNITFYGIDFSKVMYDKALENNNDIIKSGRMFLEFGEFLEYESTVKFDVIYCINVIYFWDDLKTYLLKLNSLLNTNGVVYIYMTDKDFMINFAKSSVFNKYSVDEVMQRIDESGFSCKSYASGEIGKRKGYSIKAIK